MASDPENPDIQIEESPVTAPVKRTLTDDDIRASFGGPAFHSNRFFSSGFHAGLRIAFMEQHAKSVGPHFRTAVILSYQDAISLRNLLNRQLKEIEPKLAAAEAAEKAAAIAAAMAPVKAPDVE